MDLKDWLVPLLTIAGSFFGAWFAAQFALRRFYKERIWDRKAAAYTIIFEALSDMLQWFSEHHDAYITRREIPDEEKNQLTVASKVARDQLRRRLAGETWLIPETCRKRLETMTNELEGHHDDYFSYLDESYGVIKRATDDLRKMVRADMKIN